MVGKRKMDYGTRSGSWAELVGVQGHRLSCNAVERDVNESEYALYTKSLHNPFVCPCREGAMFLGSEAVT